MRNTEREMRKRQMTEIFPERDREREREREREEKEREREPLSRLGMLLFIAAQCIVSCCVF